MVHMSFNECKKTIKALFLAAFLQFFFEIVVIDSKITYQQTKSKIFMRLVNSSVKTYLHFLLRYCLLQRREILPHVIETLYSKLFARSDKALMRVQYCRGSLLMGETDRARARLRSRLDFLLDLSPDLTMTSSVPARTCLNSAAVPSCTSANASSSDSVVKAVVWWAAISFSRREMISQSGTAKVLMSRPSILATTVRKSRSCKEKQRMNHQYVTDAQLELYIAKLCVNSLNNI